MFKVPVFLPFGDRFVARPCQRVGCESFNQKHQRVTDFSEGRTYLRPHKVSLLVAKNCSVDVQKLFQIS